MTPISYSSRPIYFIRQEYNRSEPIFVGLQLNDMHQVVNSIKNKVKCNGKYVMEYN